MGPDEKQTEESKVEKAKRASQHLRGTIGEVMKSGADRFEHDDVQLLKFHGSYQQYDRDARKQAGQGKAERQYQFMIRVSIPGGAITSEQYLALDAITDQMADGSMRITSRQGVQFHGVLMGDLRPTIAAINESLLTTLGACGDVSRNVMCCPAPAAGGLHSQVQELGQQIARALRPATRAYHELWLDGEKVETTEPEEPFYGTQYLPRKFKVALAMPGDNCVDLYTQDVGYLPVAEDDRLLGLNVIVGGGFGMTHGKPETFARLGSHLGFVEPESAVETARTVAAIFRDCGNRSDRRQARLKYLVEQWGIERFRSEFQSRVDFTLHAWRETGPLGADDHLGRRSTGNGSSSYGVYVPNGRIHNVMDTSYRTALVSAAEALDGPIAFTPQQNILFCELSSAQVDRLESILTENGMALPSKVIPLRRLSLACPALPTCGLAITDAERVMPDVLDALEALFAELGLAEERISVRMTGCPNGCARPYSADVGIVGRAAGKFDIFVGGGVSGDRLTDLFAESVPLEDVAGVLRPLLIDWKDNRTNGEELGEFYQRVHHEGPPRTILSGEKGVGVPS